LTKRKKGIELLLIEDGSHNNLFNFQQARITLRKWLL